jgi:hypothetical protein
MLDELGNECCEICREPIPRGHKHSDVGGKWVCKLCSLAITAQTRQGFREELEALAGAMVADALDRVKRRMRAASMN